MGRRNAWMKAAERVQRADWARLDAAARSVANEQDRERTLSDDDIRSAYASLPEHVAERRQSEVAEHRSSRWLKDELMGRVFAQDPYDLSQIPEQQTPTPESTLGWLREVRDRYPGSPLEEWVALAEARNIRMAAGRWPPRDDEQETNP